MFKNNTNNKNKSFKYFIIAFSLFILILSVVSVVMFMKSIDFDLNNLTGKTTTEPTADAENTETNDVSLSDLSGKSKIILICENDKKMDFVCLVETDYSKSFMNVSCFDDSDLAEKNKTFAQIYNEKSVDGVKEVLNNSLELQIDKYIVCNRTQLKDIFSLFDEIKINVETPVDYHSFEFNLELRPGVQVLSNDYIVKYLLISDNNTRSQVFCDILNSVLIPKYTENSQQLFTKFVNLCKTDISVIDYSEKVDDLIVYSKSDNKFLATVK